MKSRFALSFGISLIFVGILNIFWETSTIILLGLSVSSLIFALISIMFTFVSIKKELDDDNNSKLEWVYIIPFIILISIFCYSDSLLKYNFIKIILSSNLVNIITFISFGLLFVEEFLNHKKEVYQEKYRIMFIISKSIENMNSILDVIDQYKNSSINEEGHNMIDKLRKICMKNAKKNMIELELLQLFKDSYTLNDIEKVLSEKYEKKNKKTEKIVKK